MSYSVIYFNKFKVYQITCDMKKDEPCISRDTSQDAFALIDLQNNFKTGVIKTQRYKNTCELQRLFDHPVSFG